MCGAPRARDGSTPPFWIGFAATDGGVSDYVAVTVFYGGSWAVGRTLERGHRNAELAERPERERAAEAVRAVAEERARIARRLVAEGSTAKVLVVTTFDLDEYVFEALRAGASGFLLKDATAEELIAAVRTLAAGDAILAPAVTRRVIEAFGSVPRPEPDVAGRLAALSPREVEVLRLLARG